MAHQKHHLSRDQTFEVFLSAGVGKDIRGTKVSVLSMLAILDIDPWKEAAELCAMPEGPAQERLETLLARFKDVPTDANSRRKTAVALLAFLPHLKNNTKPLPKSIASPPALPPFGSTVYWIVGTALFLGWVILMAQGN